MDFNKWQELLEKYYKKECSDREAAIIESWLISEKIEEEAPSTADLERIQHNLWKSINDSTKKKNNITKLWPVISAVAAGVVIFSIATWMYMGYDSSAIKGTNESHDIAPGGNKATLTLSNGKTIDLSNTKTGIKIEGNSVLYNDGTAISGETIVNISGLTTISTPKGGEYQIVLSDGTKVWLNAASTLQYPAVFNERTARNVKLVSGEAYFEVFKDKKRSFVVSTAYQDVLVLGTHFNINAYELKSIKTTLLEGSVRIKIASDDQNIRNEVLLKPGEQSVNKVGSLKVQAVDTDLAVAWKNGKIEFRDADLKTVMQLLESWYNIEVVYHGVFTDSYYSGSVSRNRNISEVLQLLESTGEVHFKIEGRRVEVLQ